MKIIGIPALSAVTGRRIVYPMQWLAIIGVAILGTALVGVIMTLHRRDAAHHDWPDDDDTGR